MEGLDKGSIRELQNTGKFHLIKEMEKKAKDSVISVVARKGTSKFETPELHQIFNVFQDVASPDTLTAGQDQMNELLLLLIPWMEWRQDLVEPLFQAACRVQENNKGEVDFECVVVVLSEICKTMLKDRLKFFFAIHDADGDQLLDKGDYYRTLDAIVRSYDNEGVYESDLSALVAWTFQEADTDQDGKVSFEEICTLLLPSAAGGAAGQISAQEEADAQLGLLRSFLLQ